MGSQMKRMQGGACTLLAIIMLLGCLVGSIHGLQAEATNIGSQWTANYSKDYTLTGDNAADLVAVAKAQLGKTGSQLGHTEEWCADFVLNCAKLAKIDSDIIPHTKGAAAGCDYFYNYMLDNCAATKVSTPKAGDLVFFGPSSDLSHVAIVKSYSGGVVTWIGGNQGSGSTYLTRSVTTATVDDRTKRYLRPNYEDVHTVVVYYNANGGSIADGGDYYLGSGSYIYRDSDDERSQQTWRCDCGREYGLLSPSTHGLTRTGYTFQGWSTEKSGGTIYSATDNELIANDFYPDIETQSGTVTMYAQWKLNTVVVNYHANGGTVGNTEDYYLGSDSYLYKQSDNKKSFQTWSYNAGKEYGLLNASTYGLSREGYTFIGWSTEQSGGTVLDSKDASLITNDFYPDIATKSGGTVTMYAQWKCLGDVNTDGDVSVLDVIALQKYLLAAGELTAEQGNNADIDDSGMVNTFDLAMLKKILLSL